MEAIDPKEWEEIKKVWFEKNKNKPPAPKPKSQLPDAIFILALGLIWAGSTWLCSSWGFWQSVACGAVGIGLVWEFGKK